MLLEMRPVHPRRGSGLKGGWRSSRVTPAWSVCSRTTSTKANLWPSVESSNCCRTRPIRSRFLASWRKGCTVASCLVRERVRELTLAIVCRIGCENPRNSTNSCNRQQAVKITNGHPIFSDGLRDPRAAIWLYTVRSERYDHTSFGINQHKAQQKHVARRSTGLHIHFVWPHLPIGIVQHLP